MSSWPIGSTGTGGVDWRRAEFVLTLLGFLAFLALPIRITTVYGGLPAHPLFVHVPVILVPATVVVAVAFALKPVWLSRYGIALAVVSIVAMGSLFLTMQAGAALRGELHLQGRAANPDLRTLTGGAHPRDRLRGVHRDADPRVRRATNLGRDADGPRRARRAVLGALCVHEPARRAGVAGCRCRLHVLQDGRPRRQSRVGRADAGGSCGARRQDEQMKAKADRLASQWLSHLEHDARRIADHRFAVDLTTAVGVAALSILGLSVQNRLDPLTLGFCIALCAPLLLHRRDRACVLRARRARRLRPMAALGTAAGRLRGADRALLGRAGKRPRRGRAGRRDRRGRRDHGGVSLVAV